MLSDRPSQQRQDNTASGQHDGPNDVTLGHSGAVAGHLAPRPACPALAELAETDVVNGYSVILTQRADRPGSGESWWAVLALGVGKGCDHVTSTVRCAVVADEGIVGIHRGGAV